MRGNRGADVTTREAKRAGPMAAWSPAGWWATDGNLTAQQDKYTAIPTMSAEELAGLVRSKLDDIYLVSSWHYDLRSIQDNFQYYSRAEDPFPRPLDYRTTLVASSVRNMVRSLPPGDGKALFEKVVAPLPPPEIGALSYEHPAWYRDQEWYGKELRTRLARTEAARKELLTRLDALAEALLPARDRAIELNADESSPAYMLLYNLRLDWLQPDRTDRRSKPDPFRTLYRNTPEPTFWRAFSAAVDAAVADRAAAGMWYDLEAAADARIAKLPAPAGSEGSSGEEDDLDDAVEQARAARRTALANKRNLEGAAGTTACAGCGGRALVPGGAWVHPATGLHACSVACAAATRRPATR